MPANTQADNDTLENNQQLLLHFTASTAHNSRLRNRRAIQHNFIEF